MMNAKERRKGKGVDKKHLKEVNGLSNVNLIMSVDIRKGYGDSRNLMELVDQNILKGFWIYV